MPAFKDFVEANPSADLTDGDVVKFAMLDTGENAEATLTAVAAAPAFAAQYATGVQSLSNIVPRRLNPLPAAMTSPPTVTESAANAATTVSNPVAFVRTTRPDLFRIIGAEVGRTEDAAYDIPESTTPGNSTAFQPYAIEVVTDSPLFDISTRGTGAAYRIAVDGLYVDLDPSVQAISNGANVRIIVNSGTRAFRTFRLECDALRVAGWTFAATDTVLPARPQGPRCVIMGDSITEGSGATARMTAWPRTFGHLMGWDDVWQSGSGGTGYTLDGSPTYTGRQKMADRIVSDCLDYDPDVIILAAGYNDVAASVATVQTELAACLALCATHAPNAIVYVTSPLALGTPGSSFTTLATGLQTTAEANGATFINTLSPLLFGGTGRVGTTTSDGPADFLKSSDDVHPSQAGHDALAYAVASFVAADLKQR